MPPACACRTSALRTFIRSVAQIHVPTETLARTPWHEVRRQTQRRATISRSAGLGLQHRMVHTDTDIASSAKDEDFERASAQTERQPLPQEASAETRLETDIKLESSAEEASARVENVENTEEAIAKAEEQAVAPEILSQESNSQDAQTETDTLFQLKKRGPKVEQGNKMKLKREARIAARLARLKASEEHFASLLPDLPSGQPVEDVPTAPGPNAVASFGEEFDTTDGKRKRSEQEIARRMKKKEDQRKRAYEEKLARKKAEQARGEDRPAREQRFMRDGDRPSNKPSWAAQKEALKKKFPDGWRPHKRLSPDALSGIRALNQQFPDMFTTEVLSQRFEMSPEAIRRILRTKWEPSADEDEDRQRRWFNRGVAIWEKYEALGIKAPRRWREAAMMKNGPGRKSLAQEAEHDRVLDDEIDEAEMERQRRLKLQRRLAQNLM